MLTEKATFNARKTKSSRDGAPLSGDRATWSPGCQNQLPFTWLGGNARNAFVEMGLRGPDAV